MEQARVDYQRRRLHSSSLALLYLFFVLSLWLLGGIHLSVKAAESRIDRQREALSDAETENRVYLPWVIGAPLYQTVANGDFEEGGNLWSQYSSHQQSLIRHVADLAIQPKSGDWAALLGGLDDETSMISQGVEASPDRACLVYSQWVVSNDSCQTDYGGVGVDGRWHTVQDLCAGTATARWLERRVNLSATVTVSPTFVLNFAAVNDYSVPSILYIDDVAFYPTAECDLATARQTQSALRRELIGEEILARK